MPSRWMSYGMFLLCLVLRWAIGRFFRSTCWKQSLITCNSIRCSEYRGSTVEFDSCLNLTNPQFVASTNPKVPMTSAPDTPFKPRSGPYPAVRPAPGQSPASGFRPAPPRFVVYPSNLRSSSLIPMQLLPRSYYEQSQPCTRRVP